MKYIRGCEVSQLDSADDFYDVYLKCIRGDSSGRIYAIPGFVNGLFACELYLKFLLGEKLKDIKGKDRHDLCKLFDCLDNSIKEDIKASSKSSDYNIEELLETIGNGFILWRYIYEDGNEDFGKKHPFEITKAFLNVYLDAIKQVAHKNDKAHN